MPISDFPILKYIYDNKASKEQKDRINKTINSLSGKGYSTREADLKNLLGIKVSKEVKKKSSTKDKSVKEIKAEPLQMDSPVTSESIERTSREEDNKIIKDMNDLNAAIERIRRL